MNYHVNTNQTFPGKCKPEWHFIYGVQGQKKCQCSR